MMRRLARFLVPIAWIGATVAACDGGGLRYRSNYDVHATCGPQTSCATCTPVLGCGWCFSATGGTCVDGPEECAPTSPNFTWELSGCPEEGPDKADAGRHADAGGRVLADAAVTE